MEKVIKIAIGAVIVLLSLIFAPVSCERIDAGHEGIKVNLYGDDKGVGNISLCTGMVWYNPYTTQVLEKAWIDKWDGKLPVYGQVPTMFKDISKK